MGRRAAGLGHKIYLGLIAFSCLGTVLSASTGLDPGPIRPIASALILLVGVGLIFGLAAHKIGGRKALAALLGTLIIGGSSEVAGLYTGYPFGRYRYEAAWEPTWPMGEGYLFPLLLPVAWAMVVGACFLVASDWLSSGIAIWLTALMATLYDLLLEGVMVNVLQYWTWLDPSWPIGPGFPPGVPLMNSVGWFGTSLIAAYWLDHCRLRDAESSRTGVLVLSGHAALLAVLALVHWGIPSRL